MRRLGIGGMGVVYAGYDERLDRPVALKLVRQEKQGATHQVRMLREAQALARLSHPNVVQVYEVGEFSGQLYLAMEYIRGETLRSWLRRQRAGEGPDVAAILERFLAAGEGLAAAHEEGLIHRDFKPDDVLVGDDGRVCVVDFGLATTEAAVDARSSGRGEGVVGAGVAGKSILTLTDAVLGTPPYAAPEQLSGARADARSDVYSFAVALYEALLGVRPHSGESPEELLHNIRTRRRADADRKDLEPWLLAAVERGLEIEPDTRWPTMRAFLAALRDDPAHSRRRRRGALIAIVMTLAIAAIVMIRSRIATVRCGAEGARVEASWGPGSAAQVQAAFAKSDSPHAEATWRRVEAGLDGWSAEWSGARVEACSGSSPHDAERGACLDHALWHLEGLVGGLERATGPTLNRAVSAISRLPEIGRCDDPRWLRARGSKLRGVRLFDPTRLILERALARLRGLLDLGEHAEVQGKIGPVSAAIERLSADDLRAEARLIEGKAARKAGEHEAAASAAKDAYYMAGTLRDDRLAAEAAITVVAVVGIDQGRTESIEPWLANATMMFERGELGGTELEATWKMVRGVLHRIAGEYDAAIDAYRGALAIRTEQLGPLHPESAKVHSNIGNVYAMRGENREAVDHLRDALDTFVQSHGEHHPDVSVFRSNLAAVLDQLGEHELARAQNVLALEADELNFGEEHPNVAISVFNLGCTLADLGEIDGALEHFERAARILEEKLGPDHPQLATVWTQQGIISGKEGDLERGIRLLERAETVRMKGDPAQLALTQYHLGVLLWTRDTPEDQSRARELVSAARRVFADEDYGSSPILPEVDRWLEEHRAGGGRDPGLPTEPL